MRNLIATNRALMAALAVGALLVSAAVAVSLLTSHHGQDRAVHAHPSPNPSTSPVPTGPLSLIRGARLTDGLEVGYPHTYIGAVSAAADYLDAVASTLDPDYAASVMRIAGDPDKSALADDLAASTVTLRSDLQLATSGPLNPPVAFVTTAQMYQLRDASADDLLVLLLTDSTFIDARGGMAHTTGVFPVRMHWTAGDWKLEAIGGGQDFSALSATPDTQAAASEGWLALIAAAGGAS